MNVGVGFDLDIGDSFIPFLSEIDIAVKESVDEATVQPASEFPGPFKRSLTKPTRGYRAEDV